MVYITRFHAQCLALIAGARYESVMDGGFLTANGCKVRTKCEECDTYYILTGYAHDGSDVAKDLIAASELAGKIDSGEVYVGEDRQGNLFPLYQRNVCRNSLMLAVVPPLYA